jgi:D-alanyl-D-alanine carboxypeptidase
MPFSPLRLAAAVVLLFASTLAGAASPATPTPDLATLIRDHAATSGFSGVVRVQRDGDLMFADAFGLADRRYAAPVRVDTRFRIASITKLFTSVLVMQLVEQGKLDLDATIGAYLPDYPGPAKDKVTLRQLLTHTSGIANSDTVKSFEDAVAGGVPPYQRPGTIAELVARHASGELVAEPGSAFDYNNADYLILGQILEVVGGQSYADLLHERITGPLHLDATAMPDWQQIEPAFATAYLHVGDGKYINELPVYFENWHAAGALVSNAADVAAFSDALFAGKLISAQSLQALLTPARDEYAFGLWVAPVQVHGRADRVAHRPGSIMGANTQLLRYVDDGLTIVILANSNADDLDEFAFLIGNALTK